MIGGNLNDDLEKGNQTVERVNGSRKNKGCSDIFFLNFATS